MSQCGLYIANINSFLHQMGSEAVSQRMWGAPRVASGLFYSFSINALNTSRRILSALLSFKKPITRSICFIVFSKNLEKIGAQHRVTILFTLAVFYKNISIITSDICNSQAGDFSDSQTGTIN